LLVVVVDQRVTDLAAVLVVIALTHLQLQPVLHLQ
jgi:hypothetical protein